MSGGKLILIDGSAYIFRAFHALPPMNRKDGTPVNAVYGFTNMVMKLVDDLRPDHAIVVFDHARENFRNDIFPEYKANRGETPEELIPQFPLIRDATRALNLPMAEVPGFEADDLIAAYARVGLADGMTVVIVSSEMHPWSKSGGPASARLAASARLTTSARRCIKPAVDFRRSRLDFAAHTSCTQGKKYD